MTLSIIVAMDKNRGIGQKNGLPWTLPADLKHFKEITMGHPIIMGRKTHESIGRALPGRKNIVITRQKNLMIEGCEVVDSIESAIVIARSSLRAESVDGSAKQSYVNYAEIFVIGGGEIFQQALPLAQMLYVTEVDHVFAADIFFPAISKTEWREMSCEPHAPDVKNLYPYAFVIYERI